MKWLGLDLQKVLDLPLDNARIPVPTVLETIIADDS